MVVLELKLPIPALQCLALLRRLPKEHSARPNIEKDLRAWLKGYYGEKECSYFLSLLPEEQYYIFHGLRLVDKKAFQMDLLIITQSFALIGEVKNISGRLIFQKGSNHVTKENNNEEEGISNPILQVKRQKLQLLNWLAKNQIKGLPIECLAVISKPSTLVETTPDNAEIFNELIYAESLIDRLLQLEKKYHKPLFSKKKITQLVDLLLTSHQIHIPDVLQNYKIPKEDIKPGACCPKCQSFKMMYVSGSWLCNTCKFVSKTAYLQSVEDYFLLFGPTITRKQFGQFFQIGSTNVSGNLLRALNLSCTGTKRGTTYSLPPHYVFLQPDEKEIKLQPYPSQ